VFTVKGALRVKRLSCRWLFLIVPAGMLWVAVPGPALAQLTPQDEDRLQILSDPDALKKKLEKDKSRPPFEFFRSQVAPFDVLPYVKPYHWSTVFMDLRANHQDYDGSLQFFPVALPGMPLEVIYAREARLVKEQRSRLGMQTMLPGFPKDKELSIELLQPGAIRYDELWQVPLRLLPPHQMLVVVLSKESANHFASWNRLPSFIPAGSDREDPMGLELQRYYRLVLPEESDKAFLSAHPLTWTSISHVVWDGLPPDSLSVSHQQAMLDWLHWGGQLVLIGGAGPTYSIFRESFLGNYLPADPTNENALLGEAALKPLSDAYPPTVLPAIPLEQDPTNPRAQPDPVPFTPGGYKRPVPITPPKGRPVFVTGLRPHPGASTISLGEGSPHLLAVEARVGRGRITMLTINPTDPSLVAWPGLDTLIRRVVLRRPEEAPAAPNAFGVVSPGAPQLEGPDLSWYRIASRDVGAEAEAIRNRAILAARQAPTPSPIYGVPANRSSSMGTAEETALSRTGVAEWRDTAVLPRLCRDALEKASGISVPSSQFVLRVILAYIIAVVPLNWLVCRLLLNRREWAWVVVPLLALGFAVGVERVAAYDMGYDSACDEIDLLEVQSDYPRAHLSRFAALYTTGRAKYNIAYPNEPTAVALPYNNERSISGEDVTTAIWQSYPVPALQSFTVQPRSLAMFRGEQMLGLSGPIALEADQTRRLIVNHSEFELRDAVLVDFAGRGQSGETYLGTIAAGASIELGERKQRAAPGQVEAHKGPDPRPVLAELRRAWEDRPENSGELRLVAWIAQPMGGQTFEPPLDRYRGLTAVLVHLRYGSPPSPEGPRYNAGAASEARAARIDTASLRVSQSSPQGWVRPVSTDSEGQRMQVRTLRH
jgi:hypothetical protein